MNEIGIRIFWGPWGGEFEPEPVVSVGQVAGEIVPSAPELVKEDWSWMIRIDEAKVVYACFSKEQSSNSGKYLQLLVCVIIPKGLRLAGGKSPLELLEDVRRRFDGLFSLNLHAKKSREEQVKAEYARLLKNYSLEECPWYVFYMEGDKPASLCVESQSQLDALMRYNAYPALAHIEHLELGFKCKTTVDINTKGETDRKTKTKLGIKWLKWGHHNTKSKISSNDNLKKTNSHEEVPGSMTPPKIVSVISVPSQKNGDVVSNRELYYTLSTDFTRLSNREAIDFVNRHLGGRIKLLVGNKVPKGGVKLSEAKEAVEKGTISLFPTDIEDYHLSIDRVSIDESQHRLFVRIDAKKVRDGKKKQEKKNELFGKKGLLPKKLKVPAIITAVLVAMIVVLSIVGEIAGNNKERKEETTEEINHSSNSMLLEKEKGFPYNTHFTGTIGSKGDMTIDSQGTGSYSYELQGNKLTRNIKVKSFDSSSGHLLIESYDKNGDYVGRFDGYTQNNKTYSGTFTNFKGGKVEFDLSAD